jgi:hypothetical protein
MKCRQLHPTEHRLLATGIRSWKTDREIQFTNAGDRKVFLQSSAVHVCVRQRQEPFGSVILSDTAFHLPQNAAFPAEM